MWLKIESGIFNPFANLKKAELIEELECRNVNTDNMDRNTLKDELTELMHGVTRPPALLMKNPRISTKNLNLDSYEILHNEPLHDISNVVKNIIEELPTHIENKNVQNEFEKFAAKTVGEKNQVKGSDARRFVVQLAKFITNLNEKGLISKEFVDLVFSLVEITKISYSPFNTRSPKQLLRLFNQCFLFSMLCRQIIPIPKKMTIRKFYGIHFHCITTHLPETARIFNTKAILTENEERSFGDLRRISVSTTNRKPGWIVDNAILRFNAQQSKGEKIASYQKQDSIISKQARLLPQRPDTVFTEAMIKPNQHIFQQHLARIADFLECGEQVWWHWENHDVVFHDGQSQPSTRPEGPTLSHFRDQSIKSEIEKINTIWGNCLVKFQFNEFSLPLTRVKINKNGKNVWVNPKKQQTGVISKTFVYLDVNFFSFFV